MWKHGLYFVPRICNSPISFGVPCRLTIVGESGGSIIVSGIDSNTTPDVMRRMLDTFNSKGRGLVSFNWTSQISSSTHRYSETKNYIQIRKIFSNHNRVMPLNVCRETKFMDPNFSFMDPISQHGFASLKLTNLDRARSRRDKNYVLSSQISYAWISNPLCMDPRFLMHGFLLHFQNLPIFPSSFLAFLSKLPKCIGVNIKGPLCVFSLIRCGVFAGRSGRGENNVQRGT